MNVESLTSQICRINCTDHCIVCWSPLLHRSPDAQRKVVTSQPADRSQDSQTAKDSQNRDKEVFVPHSVTTRKNCNSIRVCPKGREHPPPPQKYILDSLKNENAIGQTTTPHSHHHFLEIPQKWLIDYLLHCYLISTPLPSVLCNLRNAMEKWREDVCSEGKEGGRGRRRDLAIKRFYWFYPRTATASLLRALQLFYLLENSILGNKNKPWLKYVRHR